MIPLPNRIIESDETIKISGTTQWMVADNEPDANSVIAYLQSQFKILETLYSPLATENQRTYRIEFRKRAQPIESEEEYTIKLQHEVGLIEAYSRNGFFYAAQTLLQLLEVDLHESGSWSLPIVELADAPRFPWRGMHLDVSRHFYTVAEVKRFLNYLARYKFNRFHWHLTDDHGWRIESKRYPRLTEIGAWRTDALGNRYGGFYTREEIEEVVAYAETLCITVVPEIELPGHSRAALAAYPELGCTGVVQPVPTEWGVFEDVYCSGKEATFEFLTTILDEVIELFPGQYIHIGGDECPKVRWKQCPHCHARMKSEGIDSFEELQSYFVHRIVKHLQERGKQAIGWDEILEGGLAQSAIVMSWRGVAGGIAAVEAGHQAIMSPTSHCYFDYYQGPRETEPEAFPNDLPLARVYEFDPFPPELSLEQSKSILGGQGNVWTERIPNWSHLEYMLFPRITAMAEALWTKPERRDYADFMKRVEQEIPIWQQRRISFRKP
ncbi:MAG: beta-N-acetylhexosaminidase [bacterium]|nr:beta-N-acetylhexosaminidase [bacterium]